MENRYCVIMCGGVGSRFWPFSTASTPKQFIDFFGTGRSLLQMSFDRISGVVPVRNIIAITNKQYAPQVREQLPELADDQILLEPDRRNTAPCIAWAAYHIRAINPEAQMVVIPSDHLILKEDVFRQSLLRSFDFLKRNHPEIKRIHLFGMPCIRPEFTAAGFEFDDETPQAVIVAFHRAFHYDDLCRTAYLLRKGIRLDDRTSRCASLSQYPCGLHSPFFVILMSSYGYSFLSEFTGRNKRWRRVFS